MRNPTFAVLPCLIVICISGACLAETKEGPCKLKKSSAFDKDVFTVKVGKVIKGTCKFYIDEFFGKKIVNAGISLENTGKKPMFCHYYVAFFDKDGKLLGCAGQGTFGKEGMAAGKKTMLGSCLIPMPHGKHEQIASYKVAFYESEMQVGKAAK